MNTGEIITAARELDKAVTESALANWARTHGEELVQHLLDQQGQLETAQRERSRFEKANGHLIQAVKAGCLALRDLGNYLTKTKGARVRKDGVRNVIREPAGEMIGLMCVAQGALIHDDPTKAAAEAAKSVQNFQALEQSYLKVEELKRRLEAKKPKPRGGNVTPFPGGEASSKPRGGNVTPFPGGEAS